LYFFIFQVLTDTSISIYISVVPSLKKKTLVEKTTAKGLSYCCAKLNFLPAAIEKIRVYSAVY
jgi:hypothetical protein